MQVLSRFRNVAFSVCTTSQEKARFRLLDEEKKRLMQPGHATTASCYRRCLNCLTLWFQTNAKAPWTGLAENRLVSNVQNARLTEITAQQDKIRKAAARRGWGVLATVALTACGAALYQNFFSPSVKAYEELSRLVRDNQLFEWDSAMNAFDVQSLSAQQIESLVDIMPNGSQFQCDHLLSLLTLAGAKQFSSQTISRIAPRLLDINALHTRRAAIETLLLLPGAQDLSSDDLVALLRRSLENDESQIVEALLQSSHVQRISEEFLVGIETIYHTSILEFPFAEKLSACSIEKALDYYLRYPLPTEKILQWLHLPHAQEFSPETINHFFQRAIKSSSGDSIYSKIRERLLSCRHANDLSADMIADMAQSSIAARTNDMHSLLHLRCAKDLSAEQIANLSSAMLKKYVVNDDIKHMFSFSHAQELSAETIEQLARASLKNAHWGTTSWWEQLIALPNAQGLSADTIQSMILQWTKDDYSPLLALPHAKDISMEAIQKAITTMTSRALNNELILNVLQFLGRAKHAVDLPVKILQEVNSRVTQLSLETLAYVKAHNLVNDKMRENPFVKRALDEEIRENSSKLFAEFEGIRKRYFQSLPSFTNIHAMHPMYMTSCVKDMIKQGHKQEAVKLLSQSSRSQEFIDNDIDQLVEAFYRTHDLSRAITWPALPKKQQGFFESISTIIQSQSTLQKDDLLSRITTALAKKHPQKPLPI